MQMGSDALAALAGAAIGVVLSLHTRDSLERLVFTPRRHCNLYCEGKWSHHHRVLTQARAMVVRQSLADNFKLDDSRLKTKGWG